MAPNSLASGRMVAAETDSHNPGTLDSRQKTSSRSPSTCESLGVGNNIPPLSRPKYEWKIVWRNVLAFIYLHAGALFGMYLMATNFRVGTFLFSMFYGLLGGYGITAGAHRLWTHQCYKANIPLRIFLTFCNTIAFQNHVYEWARDHRVHHKFTDTDADPHNSRRGFFFSHMGWLLMRKHQDVKQKGKTIDMTDLEQDSIVMFQKKYYLLVMPLCTFIIPYAVLVYILDERPLYAYHVGLVRYVFTLHFTWLVNSAAHLWGTKPYDRFMSPVENIYVGILAFGEGWHNYHHAFPWDYKTSEFSGYSVNITTAFIDFFAKIGWAYDLKTVKPEMIEKRALRTGDGSWVPSSGRQNSRSDLGRDSNVDVWGYDDCDLSDIERAMIAIINRKDVPSNTEKSL